MVLTFIIEILFTSSRPLLDELKKAFPEDDVRPKKFGVAMADVVQVVVTKTGLRIPPIVYDRKTGESVTKSDMMKAKNYKTVHNTDYSIIVTVPTERSYRNFKTDSI